jgi:hypothetical protein
MFELEIQKLQQELGFSLYPNHKYKAIKYILQKTLKNNIEMLVTKKYNNDINLEAIINLEKCISLLEILEKQKNN